MLEEKEKELGDRQRQFELRMKEQQEKMRKEKVQFEQTTK